MDPFAGYVTDPMSRHRYQYGHANPVMFVDPSGMFSLLETFVGMHMPTISHVLGSRAIEFVRLIGNEKFSGHMINARISHPLSPGVMRRNYLMAPRFSTASLGRRYEWSVHIQIVERPDDRHERAKEGIELYWSNEKTTPWGSIYSGRVFVNFVPAPTDGASILIFNASSYSDPNCRASGYQGGRTMFVCQNSDSYSYAHEFGHILGFADKHLENGDVIPPFYDDIIAGK